MVKREIKIISLADTIGLATPDQVRFALETLIPQYPNTSFGVHLHSTPLNWQEKLDAAVSSGCYRIDGALKGIGGCPMASDDLVGNMATERIINRLEEKYGYKEVNRDALVKSLELANRIFH
jgi:hydroxymethylglutaryl-CoA lyase